MTPAELRALETRLRNEILEQVRRELDIDRRKTLSDVEAEMQSVLLGVQAHVDRTIHSSMEKAFAPMLGRIGQVEELAALIIEARANKQETREVLKAAQEALREHVALGKAQLAIKGDVEATKLDLETKHKRRLALFAAIAALMAAFSGCAGALINSWTKPTK